jgi:hypothetical protein
MIGIDANVNETALQKMRIPALQNLAMCFRHPESPVRTMREIRLPVFRCVGARIPASGFSQGWRMASNV